MGMIQPIKEKPIVRQTQKRVCYLPVETPCAPRCTGCCNSRNGQFVRHDRKHVIVYKLNKKFDSVEGWQGRARAVRARYESRLKAGTILRACVAPVDRGVGHWAASYCLSFGH